MDKKRTLPLLFIIAVSIIGFSCGYQKKSAITKRDLSIVDSQLQQHDKNLQLLEARKKTKLEENKIDDTASVRLQRFIDKTKTEISKLVNENTVLIGTAEVNKSDWERLNKNLSASQMASKKINDRMLFLNDLINGNTVINLDQDVLFEPGKYTVSKTVADAIGKFFEPPTKEIDLFIKKYPDFPMSLVITAKGYADATSIAEGSGLYIDLKDKLSLSGKPLTSENLNKELSDARAKAVIELFSSFTKGRASDGGNIKNVAYLYEGKGEALPDPKVKDYKVNDPRRRIVMLFWCVFPD